MKEFPLPSEPTPNYAAFESALGRWLLVALPIMGIGLLLGALALFAALISTNFNILNWVE